MARKARPRRTHPALESLEARQLLTADLAGNTVAAARAITPNASPTTYVDAVDAADVNDLYRFSLAGRSALSLTLGALTADADLQLFNGSGVPVAISQNRGIAADVIAGTFEAGTYFIRVFQVSGEANYQLAASATPLLGSALPVSVSARSMVSFSELDITGASGDDTITIYQSGTTLGIVANNVVSYAALNGAGELVIHGGAGNDAITVTNSVTIQCRVYGDAGNDTLINKTNGRATIVSIGGGIDVLVGNGLNTSYWADTGDVVTRSPAENAAGRVHVIGAFYQPAGSAVPLELSGQNLTDPADSSSVTRPTGSFWGTGPVMNDVNQGGVADCYFLSTLAGLANSSPGRLVETAVDLGDGTYAVQFVVSGSRSVVRVDGDLPVGPWNGLGYAHPGASGNLWAPLMEKAYAFYRKGQSTYASLAVGWMGDVLSNLGIANMSMSTGAGADVLYNAVSTALAAGRSVTTCTNSRVAAGVPAVANHCYTVIGALRDGLGQVSFLLRNPWGYDGVANPSNLSDGVVTITAAQLAGNFSSVALVA